MSDHRPRDWRGVGTWLRPRKGHFHGHSVSHWGWPQGKVTGTPGRLFGHWWEKRKEAGGLAWAVAPPGTEDRREGKAAGRAAARTPWRAHKEVGLYYEVTCVPTKDVLKSQLPGPQNVILCGNKVIEVIIH